MNKKLSFLLFTFCLTFQCYAQNSFSFKAPEIKKIVKTTTPGLNIRQDANVKSKKVGYLSSQEIVAVVGEVGEWYKICSSGWEHPYEGGNAIVFVTSVGYIMKKYCKDVALEHISKAKGDLYIVNSGRHKGMCLVSSYDAHEESWLGASLCIGNIVGNMAIIPYRVKVEFIEDDKRMSFNYEDGEYKLYMNESIFDGNNILCNKLTDSDIDFIINNISKMSMKSGRILLRVPGEDYSFFDYTEIRYGGGLDKLELIPYNSSGNINKASQLDENSKNTSSAATKPFGNSVPYTDFRLPDNNGIQHNLSEWVGKGKWVFVSFWSSYIKKCKEDAVVFVDIYQKYHEKGFEIIGVSFDDKKERWQKAIIDLNMNWPQLSELKGWQSCPSKIYDIHGLPENLLINPEGNIVDRNMKISYLSERLKQIFGE
jgi:peroxiredoxin